MGVCYQKCYQKKSGKGWGARGTELENPTKRGFVIPAKYQSVSKVLKKSVFRLIFPF